MPSPSPSDMVHGRTVKHPCRGVLCITACTAAELYRQEPIRQWCCDTWASRCRYQHDIALHQLGAKVGVGCLDCYTALTVTLSSDPVCRRLLNSKGLKVDMHVMHDAYFDEELVFQRQLDVYNRSSYPCYEEVLSDSLLGAAAARTRPV